MEFTAGSLSGVLGDDGVAGRCHITENWRGRPLIIHEVIVNLIANTTTTQDLEIQAALDDARYPTGIVVSDRDLRVVNLVPAGFHGEDWNYTIKPHADRKRTVINLQLLILPLPDLNGLYNRMTDENGPPEVDDPLASGDRPAQCRSPTKRSNEYARNRGDQEVGFLQGRPQHHRIACDYEINDHH